MEFLRLDTWSRIDLGDPRESDNLHVCGLPFRLCSTKMARLCVLHCLHMDLLCDCAIRQQTAPHNSEYWHVFYCGWGLHHYLSLCHYATYE